MALPNERVKSGGNFPMSKGRLEAFSDGVFAVIITIMVLEMKVPRGTDLQALRSVVPVFLSYVLATFTLASTGTTITTCCRRRNTSRAEFFGLISSFCSVSRWYLSQLPGWGKITMRRFRWRYME